MDKIWKPKGKKSDKLILIHEKCIYKGSPNREVISQLTVKSQKSKIPKGLYSIPYNYIQKITNQKGINHIKLILGKDSEEELFIEDETLKDEVFEYLKSQIPNFQYKSETPSIFKYVKPKIIGIIVLTLLFTWASYFAIQMENGYNYDAARGITGIAIGLATFGTFKLTIGYVIILGITVFSLIKKLKMRSEVQTLER